MRVGVQNPLMSSRNPSSPARLALRKRRFVVLRLPSVLLSASSVLASTACDSGVHTKSGAAHGSISPSEVARSRLGLVLPGLLSWFACEVYGADEARTVCNSRIAASDGVRQTNESEASRVPPSTVERMSISLCMSTLRVLSIVDVVELLAPLTFRAPFDRVVEVSEGESGAT